MPVQRINRSFKDISMSFQVNPLTDDLIAIKNQTAISRSIRNLVLTTPGERFFNNGLGSQVNNLLFENVDDLTASSVKSEIENTIRNFEPRARLVSVRALPDMDRNSYEVIIEFYIVNTPTELVDLSIMLERLR